MNNMKMKLTIFFVLALLILPSFAYANAGTPLMWLSMLHLAFGNLFIGIFEGYLISRFLNVAKLRSMSIMILANYFSAATGAGVISLLAINQTSSWGIFYFNHLRLTIVSLYIFLFVITVVLEAPFIMWILKKKTFNKILKYSFWVQLSSYILISPLYFLCTSANLGSDWKVVESKNFKLQNGYVLFLNEKTDTLNKIEFSDLNSEKVLESIPQKLEYEKLFLDLTTEDKVHVMYEGEFKTDKSHKIDKSFMLKTIVDLDSADNLWINVFHKKVLESKNPKHEEYFHVDDFKSCGHQPVELNNKLNEWKIKYVGWWPIEGIGFENSKGEFSRLAVETPPFWWGVSCPTVLNDDNIIVKLGPHLVLVNMMKKELAWLAYGREPIVVLEK